MDKNITDAQIETLSCEAGDLRQEAICFLALRGRAALRSAKPDTERRALLASGRGQAWARRQCAAAINAARAQEQS